MYDKNTKWRQQISWVHKSYVNLKITTLYELYNLIYNQTSIKTRFISIEYKYKSSQHYLTNL